MTLQERAAKFADKYVAGYAAIIVKIIHKVAEESYLSGAQAQMDIDAEEMRIANEEWLENVQMSRKLQKKIDIDKACEWLKDNPNTNNNGKIWKFYIDNFRKAMEE